VKHAKQQGRLNLHLNKTLACWCGRVCGLEDFDALVAANFFLSNAPEVIVVHMGVSLTTQFIKLKKHNDGNIA